MTMRSAEAFATMQQEGYVFTRSLSLPSARAELRRITFSCHMLGKRKKNPPVCTEEKQKISLKISARTDLSLSMETVRQRKTEAWRIIENQTVTGWLRDERQGEWAQTVAIVQWSPPPVPPHVSSTQSSPSGWGHVWSRHGKLTKARDMIVDCRFDFRSWNNPEAPERRDIHREV